METNIPVEQAIVQKTRLGKSNRINGEAEKNSSNKKAFYNRKVKMESNLADLDNGPMLSTSEILDFSSGIDSTEYDQPTEK